MLYLFLAAYSSLFVPSKIEKQYSDLAVCPAGHPAEKGCKGLERGGAFHDKRFEKSRCELYSLLSALIMSFLIVHFRFRFYSTWWSKHLRKHFILHQFPITNKSPTRLMGSQLVSKIYITSKYFIAFHINCFY